MSGLALVARQLGAEVTGSDRAPDSPYLRSAGLPVAAHDAANVPEDAVVVVSSAIPSDNPERAIARLIVRLLQLLRPSGQLSAAF